MNKPLSVAIAAMFAVAPLASALALDIENQDDQAYQLVIENDNGESKELEIGSGGKAQNICESCYIHLDGQDPVSAEGDEVVRIKDGEFNIKG